MGQREDERPEVAASAGKGITNGRNDERRKWTTFVRLMMLGSRGGVHGFRGASGYVSRNQEAATFSLDEVPIESIYSRST